MIIQLNFYHKYNKTKQLIMIIHDIIDPSYTLFTDHYKTLMNWKPTKTIYYIFIKNNIIFYSHFFTVEYDTKISYLIINTLYLYHLIHLTLIKHYLQIAGLT